MRIEENHKYHGSALTQIVEFPTFKAINVLVISGKHTSGAFLVNNNIAVYMKTDSVGPTEGKYPEFKFTFSSRNVAEVGELMGKPGLPSALARICPVVLV